MKLIRIDSDDGPIFFMQIANVEGILTIEGVDVVVEFIPGVWSDGGRVAFENHSITRMLARPVSAPGTRR